MCWIRHQFWRSCISKSRIRSDRFVSTWNVCQRAKRMTRTTNCMYSSGISLWNMSLIELTKIVFGVVQRSGSASFSERAADQILVRTDDPARHEIAQRMFPRSNGHSPGYLRAPSHGVPGGVGPFDRGVSCHRQSLVRMCFGDLHCSRWAFHGIARGKAKQVKRVACAVEQLKWVGGNPCKHRLQSSIEILADLGEICLLFGRFLFVEKPFGLLLGIEGVVPVGFTE